MSANITTETVSLLEHVKVGALLTGGAVVGGVALGYPLDKIISQHNKQTGHNVGIATGSALALSIAAPHASRLWNADTALAKKMKTGAYAPGGITDEAKTEQWFAKAENAPLDAELRKAALRTEKVPLADVRLSAEVVKHLGSVKTAKDGSAPDSVRLGDQFSGDALKNVERRYAHHLHNAPPSVGKLIATVKESVGAFAESGSSPAHISGASARQLPYSITAAAAMSGVAFYTGSRKASSAACSSPTPVAPPHAAPAAAPTPPSAAPSAQLQAALAQNAQAVAAAKQIDANCSVWNASA